MNKFAEISSNKNPADLVPHSVEAEQQLLGGILNNNDLKSVFLLSEDINFHSQFHKIRF